MWQILICGLLSLQPTCREILTKLQTHTSHIANVDNIYHQE